MTELRPRTLSVPAILLCVAMLLAGCSTDQPPNAQAGTIDLSGWDLEQHQLLRLDGTWRILPMDLDASWIDAPLPDHAPSQLVPGNWSQLMPRYGYATLQLQVRLPHDEPRPYLIHTELGGSAHELYADGELVLKRGELGTSVETVRAEWADTLGRAELGGTTRLVWRIANFHHTPGGIQAAPDLGHPQAILRHQRLVDALYFGVAGALFLIGVYHLLIWGLRRRERTPLWFGLLSLIMALRFPVVDHFLTASLAGNYNELEGTLSYLTFYLGVPTLAMFIDSMFPRRWFRTLKWVTLVVGVLFSLPVLALGQHRFSATLPWYQGWTMAVGSLMIARALQIIYEGETGAYLFGLGAVAVVTAGFHDILWNQRVLNLAVTITPLAMLIFVVAQALAIGRRYAEAQRTVEHLTEHLREEVAAKTSELQEAVEKERRLREQLSAALRRAEAAAEAKAQFLANMSHELRTPLNGVVGMAELMLRSGLRGQHRQFARTILRSGESLLSIINDLLDFSKAEAGELALDAADFDLRRCAEQVVELLAPQADQKDVDLVLDIDPQAPVEVRGDPERLRQVLINLVGNAVKFTDHGEVVLRLHSVDDSRGHERSAPRSSVRFEVEDTGIGMSEEQVDRIFDAFVQADTSTTRQYGGTGLGLAISQHVVSLMGGSIQVESEPSVGSTFSFTLEFPPADEPVDTRFALPKPIRQLRVLALIPGSSSRTALEHIFEERDIDHTLVADFDAATAALQQAHARSAPYDLALVDGDALPCDPLEFRSEVADRPPWSQPRLVFAVTLGYWRRHPDPGEFDGASFVTKPLHPSNLSEALAESAGLEAPHEIVQTRVGPVADISPGDDARPRILVADDNAINRRVTARLLEAIGYDYDVVTDGEQAVEAFGNSHYDAVLLDCQMPKMDGIEAARRIRELEPADRHTPILAVSAGTADRDAPRARQAGMDDFITKPIGADRLKAALDQWLGD